MEHSTAMLKSDLEAMEIRLNDMKEELIDVKTELSTINSKLTQVVDAILGNPLTKSGGFIEDIDVLKDKVKFLETKQNKNDIFKNRVYWTVGIIISILLLLQYLSTIYYNIKH